jgi:hypothetical protein
MDEAFPKKKTEEPARASVSRSLGGLSRLSMPLPTKTPLFPPPFKFMKTFHETGYKTPHRNKIINLLMQRMVNRLDDCFFNSTCGAN